MRLSGLFTKTKKEALKNEVAQNAQLLIRGGYIYKEMAGVYSYLPLGLRVLKKIENIIREEMNAIGGQEVLMTTLQDPDVWKTSGRWNDAVVDNWFKTELKNGQQIGIANTHEEPLVRLLTRHVSSYRDLPLYVYQIQNKFRNELRAKSGILRGREFLMKDLYSFSRTEEEFRTFYEECVGAYMRIFTRVGIGEKTYRTVAAGGSFTHGLTDEFQALCEAGEDTIYIDEEKKFAVNKEVLTDETLEKIGIDKARLKEARSIEVGNIFPLGSKYTEALGLSYRDEDGAERPIIMGSYGIGIGRLMGTIVEICSDKNGLIWPETVAPYAAHLIEISSGGVAVKAKTEEVYEKLKTCGVEVLYDDRDVSAGQKFADADLLGVPFQIIISEKTLAKGDQAEMKERHTGSVEGISIQDVYVKLSRNLSER